MRFHESEEELLASLVTFLEPMLGGDEAGVVILRPHLHQRLEAALVDRGADLAELRGDDRLVVVDTGDALAGFMLDGAPDPDRFATSMNEVIDRADRAHRPVRIFGEVVALLWDDGNLAGALALEDLWNELADTRPFTLLCGYPISAFATDASTAGFRQVCDRHSSVIPCESSAPAHVANQGRAIAAMQQQLLAADTARDEWHTVRDELQERLEDLDELGRLRERFVTTVVHDLRTPTTLVSTALGLLRQSLPELDEDADQLVTMALQGTERIGRLVADVLTAAQIHAEAFSYEVRDVDLGPIVEQAVRGVRLSTGRSVEYRQQDGLRAAAADEHRQLQILDNLLWNAVKFSPQDTPVRVELTGSAERLTVSVADDGVGIAQEDQAAMFHPFSRLGRGEVPGTGLGLSITKALVEGQGGSIQVESRPGTGSVFSYTVPVAR